MAEYALAFRGSVGDRIQSPAYDANPFCTGEFEVECRFKVTDLLAGTRQVIWSATYAIRGNVTDVNCALEFYNGGIRFTRYTTSHSFVLSTTTLVEDQWYTAKIVQTLTGRELWINGVLEDSDSMTECGNGVEDQGFIVGANQTGTSYRLAGQVDYIHVVDTSASGRTQTWNFTEGSGTVITEDTASAPNATFYSPPGSDAQWILLPSGLSSVSNAISIDWSMLAEVSNGYQSLWNLLNSVSGQTSFKWELLQSVLSNSELNWSLVESINNNVQFDWDLLAALAAVSNSTQAKWNLLNQISNDLDVEWDLLASVGSSIQLGWDLLSALASISRGVQLKWDMAGQVKAQLDAQWNLLEAVGVTTDLRWNLAVNVANQVQAQWDLLQGIKSNVDLVWDSIAATSNGLEFRWSLLSESVRIPIHVMLVLDEDRIMKILN